MTQVVATLFLILAGFFLLVSTVGLLRLPDFFSRAHAVGKSETLGALLFLIGLSIHSGLDLNTVKLFLILFLIAVTNPTGVHTLTRAGLRKGLDIWTEHGSPTTPSTTAGSEPFPGEAGPTGPGRPP
jgi:multicomponent Na+:H+ antiporter subunit G